MRKKRIFIIIGLGLFLIACSVKHTPTIYIGNWKEKTLDFSEVISFQDDNNLLDLILEYKYFGFGDNEFIWVRNSNNLADFFQVIKKIGLQRLLSKDEYNQILKEDGYLVNKWIGESLKSVVDSLIVSYNKDIETNYYSKFWKRRRLEKNDKVVLDILKQTDAFYNHNKIQDINTIKRNDLYRLMLYNIDLNASKDSVTSRRLTIEYFDYLKSIGLEHSSYNLIYETYLCQFVLDKRDSLLSTLKYDTISEEKYWRNRNKASWIKTYRDNGP